MMNMTEASTPLTERCKMGAHFMYSPLKSPSTYQQQLALLKSRGIVVNSTPECESFLQRVNYYRLTGYTLPFKDSASDTFKDLSFYRLECVYYFDTELRNLVALAIEKVEIYLRAQLSYYHAHHYGAEGYMDANHFNARHKHIEFQERVTHCISDNSKSPVVKHHISKYGGKFPIWVIIDYFSLGMLSYFYTDMKNPDKAYLAQNLYGTSFQVLTSWLKCLTDLRNRCAHYSRLYYWIFPAVPKGMKGDSFVYGHDLFSQLYMLKQLYPEKDRWNEDFLNPLSRLIKKYNSYIELSHIGFPNNWKSILKQP